MPRCCRLFQSMPRPAHAIRKSTWLIWTAEKARHTKRNRIPAAAHPKRRCRTFTRTSGGYRLFLADRRQSFLDRVLHIAAPFVPGSEIHPHIGDAGVLQRQERVRRPRALEAVQIDGG